MPASDAPDPNRLLEQTTTAAADRLADAEVALLPTGAVEQHGPALPLGLDLLVARALADSIDRADAVSLPVVPVGVSATHRQFDGTLSVSPETFGAYVEEVVESLADHGVRKVVFVNGHGENGDALHRAARRLRASETAFAAPWNWWSNLGDLPADLLGTEAVGHADEVESSVLLSVAPHLVREDALEDAEAGAADEWGETVAGASLPLDTADFAESGAAGSPTRASREAGERLFEAASEDLSTLVEWLADRPFESLRPPAHR